ncbi:MAG: thioredoxin [Gemmataceae bacterium]
MNALNITSANFEQEVLNSNDPVLVDFWAPWCGPCRAVSPIVEELAEELQGRAKVVKVNVDDAQEIAAKYQVSSIPNFVVFKDGEVQTQLTGARPKQALLAALEPHLN